MKINGGGISKKQWGHQRNSRHRQYRRALLNNTRNDKEFWQISSSRSCIHDLNTLIVRKKTKKKTKKTTSCSLNPIDCKRFVLPNCIDTLSYGHYSLRWTLCVCVCVCVCTCMAGFPWTSVLSLTKLERTRTHLRGPPPGPRKFWPRKYGNIRI